MRVALLVLFQNGYSQKDAVSVSVVWRAGTPAENNSFTLPAPTPQLDLSEFFLEWCSHSKSCSCGENLSLSVFLSSEKMPRYWSPSNVLDVEALGLYVSGGNAGIQHQTRLATAALQRTGTLSCRTPGRRKST